MGIDENLEQDIERIKKRTGWGCLTGAIILVLGLVIIVVRSSYLFAIFYFFFLMVIFSTIQYFPMVTLPVAIFSLVRKKNKQRTIVAIAVILTIKLLNNINRNGRGPTETEYFMWQLQEGSIWIYLSIIGYLYLFYWWVIFFKRRKN